MFLCAKGFHEACRIHTPPPPPPPAVRPKKKTETSAAEQEARKAWRDIQTRAQDKDLSAAKKWVLGMSIQAFETQHGGTEFAASIAGELAKIKVRAQD